MALWKASLRSGKGQSCGTPSSYLFALVTEFLSTVKAFNFFSLCLILTKRLRNAQKNTCFFAMYLFPLHTVILVCPRECPIILLALPLKSSKLSMHKFCSRIYSWTTKSPMFFTWKLQHSKPDLFSI